MTSKEKMSKIFNRKCRKL